MSHHLAPHRAETHTTGSTSFGARGRRPSDVKASKQANSVVVREQPPACTPRQPCGALHASSRGAARAHERLNVRALAIRSAPLRSSVLLTRATSGLRICSSYLRALRTLHRAPGLRQAPTRAPTLLCERPCGCELARHPERIGRFERRCTRSKSCPNERCQRPPGFSSWLDVTCGEASALE